MNCELCNLVYWRKVECRPSDDGFISRRKYVYRKWVIYKKNSLVSNVKAFSLQLTIDGDIIESDGNNVVQWLSWSKSNSEFGTAHWLNLSRNIFLV